MRLIDLLETHHALTVELQSSLPPTFTMPTLKNSDAYLQYRHLIALASARSVKNDGDHMDDKSPWGENQTVVCYTTADQETLKLANEMLGVSSIALSSTPSHEASSIETRSPVRPFVDIMENLWSGSNDQNCHDHGTIGLLKMPDSCCSMIADWCNKNGIPCLDPHELHCTVLYSRKPVPHLVEVTDHRLKIGGSINGWRKFGSCLVLELDSPEIHKIHGWMRSHGGTHDHPEFIPHVTVCYDHSDEIPNIAPNFDLEFNKLLVKPIDPDYVKNLF